MLYLQVFSLDSWQRNRIEGYGYCQLPDVAGRNSFCHIPRKELGVQSYLDKHGNLLSTNLIKWSNTLKQFDGKLPTNCLSVLGHFLGLALKGIITHFRPVFFSMPPEKFENLSVSYFQGDKKGTLI